MTLDLNVKYRTVSAPERGTAFRNRRPSVPLFRADTWRIHQIACQKPVGEASTSANCKEHARPFPPPCREQQWSLPRRDPERRQEQEVIMWGESTLSFYCFLLQYLLGWPVRGPSTTQRVYVFMCLLGCQTQKGILPINVSCVIFLSAYIFNNIARFLAPPPNEITWYLKFALKYSTKDKNTLPWDPAGN